MWDLTELGWAKRNLGISNFADTRPQIRRSLFGHWSRIQKNTVRSEIRSMCSLSGESEKKRSRSQKSRWRDSQCLAAEYSPQCSTFNGQSSNDFVAHDSWWGIPKRSKIILPPNERRPESSKHNWSLWLSLSFSPFFRPSYRFGESDTEVKVDQWISPPHFIESSNGLEPETSSPGNPG